MRKCYLLLSILLAGLMVVEIQAGTYAIDPESINPSETSFDSKPKQYHY